MGLIWDFGLKVGLGDFGGTWWDLYWLRISAATNSTKQV